MINIKSAIIESTLILGSSKNLEILGIKVKIKTTKPIPISRELVGRFP
jgi:hypothetical protein